MRNTKRILAVLALTVLPAAAMARLTPFEDYTLSETVSQVSTIRVNANMMDQYLEGIRDTWVASNEVAKRLGHIKDYEIYISDLPNSGDFNLVLVTIFANTADLAPNQERYKEFMKEWGAAHEEQSEQLSTTVYPNIREITGGYQMRRLTIKLQ